MFFKHRGNNDMIEVIGQDDLTNLFHNTVLGRYQVGEEQQDPESFNKSDLLFLSGEELPRCWTDPHYRQHNH
ncbi:acetyltransferase [Moritella sp. 24]|uniref:acetyltransferase n=1 Tax=Moritella sp. 24 TaxID=2746230 RepID=UPI001BA70FDF|nr:acetyltransferase [Moritella sp. 24]QUM76015.1 acetyltransferase [Moritella sp. 24]